MKTKSQNAYRNGLHRVGTPQICVDLNEAQVWFFFPACATYKAADLKVSLTAEYFIYGRRFCRYLLFYFKLKKFKSFLDLKNMFMTDAFGR